jgi:cathepsin X
MVTFNMAFTNAGILDNDHVKGINHIISIVGWGEDEASGKKYWILVRSISMVYNKYTSLLRFYFNCVTKLMQRNSWGEYWGEMGYARVVRGRDQLNIESACAWGMSRKRRAADQCRFA